MRMDKIKYLDGLRGLAAFVVVLSHFAVVFYPALYTANASEVRFVSQLDLIIAGTPLNVIYNGNFAVCIFFILSGYVLTYKFFRDKNPETLVSGAFRRYFRLLVPVLFSNLLVFIFMKLSLFHNVQAGNITKSTWWFTEAWTFRPELLSMLKESFFGVFVLDECNYNPVLWTMRYEFFGSFLVFFLAATIGRYKHRNIIYFFLCCLLFQTYYLAFVAGLILCDLTFNGYLEVFGKVIPKLVLLGLFLGSYPAGMEVTNTIYYLFEIRVINNNPLLFHILGSVCIMLGIINSKRLQHFFSIKILQFLGRISFPMYLVHLTLIGTFSCFLFVKLTGYLDYNVAFIVTFLLSLLLIFSFSAIINKYIDEKGILLTHKMYKFIKDKLQKAS
jgi:peptidoglycan/LPS O-acetylase OafA/YrhL